MTSSTSKITLPGLSFCAYQDNHRSQNAAKLEQAFIALGRAIKNAEKIEDPVEKAAAFRMLHETEQALVAAFGTTNLKDFPSVVDGIIQKLESFSKQSPINRAAAKSGLRSAQEKITSANLALKTPEKRKPSPQADPAGAGSPQLAQRVHQQQARTAPVKAEKATEGAATASAQTPASEDLHFPSQKELLKCLSEHPILSTHDKQKKINEAAVKSFANRTIAPSNVQTEVTQILADLAPELRFRPYLIAGIGESLTKALKDCVNPASAPKASDQPKKPLQAHEKAKLSYQKELLKCLSLEMSPLGSYSCTTMKKINEATAESFAHRTSSEDNVTLDISRIVGDLIFDLREPTLTTIKMKLIRSVHHCLAITPAPQDNSGPDATPPPSTQPKSEQDPLLRKLNGILKDLMHKRPSPFSDVS